MLYEAGPYLSRFQDGSLLDFALSFGVLFVWGPDSVLGVPQPSKSYLPPRGVRLTNFSRNQNLLLPLLAQ